MGEPAGIGPDLLLRLYAERSENGVAPFIVFGNARFLAARAARLGLSLKICATRATEACAVFPEALPVVDIEGLMPDHPGTTSHMTAPLVIAAISEATGSVLSGTCRGLITAPIHKGALYEAGFQHPGHTEFLAELCANNGPVPLPVMMLAYEDLRVVPLTIHVPLSQVVGLVTPELLAKTAHTLAHDLRTRFGIATPKIGVTGLNPHAGEGGTIGLEELDLIGPTVARLAHEGMAISGPFPADTLFYPPHWRQYDAVIAMYHDQALIPIKTIAFEAAVNVTLGLPIVRTSPDHGTAFDLAGTGKASIASFLAAVKLADKLTGEPG